QDRKTGKYLKADGTWAAGIQIAYSNSTTAWAAPAVIHAVVEGMPAGRARQSTTTLRVTILNDTPSSTVFADDIELWPSWDTVAPIGHNLDIQVTCDVQSSDDGVTFTSRATPTIYEPSFAAVLAALRDERFLKVKFPGTNVDPILIGELVVCQRLTLQRSPS